MWGEPADSKTGPTRARRQEVGPIMTPYDPIPQRMAEAGQLEPVLLVDKGQVVKQGAGRGTRYVPVGDQVDREVDD